MSRENYHISAAISTALTPPYFTTIMPDAMKNRVLVLLVLILSAIIIILSGCSGYKEVTLTRKGIQFSFEYPSSYIDTNDTLREDSQHKYAVILKRPSNNPTIDEFDTNFAIWIYDIPDNAPDANTLVQDLLQSRENLPSYHEYEFIEHSSVEVAGIQAELIVYSMKSLGVGEVLATYPSVYRDIYFDYEEHRVDIHISSFPELAEQVEKEFEHIINSFKFLD